MRTWNYRIWIGLGMILMFNLLNTQVWALDPCPEGRHDPQQYIDKLIAYENMVPDPVWDPEPNDMTAPDWMVELYNDMTAEEQHQACKPLDRRPKKALTPEVNVRPPNPSGEIRPEASHQPHSDATVDSPGNHRAFPDCRPDSGL